MDFNFKEIELGIRNGTYKRIGKGSSREVFDLNNGYVVKMAINLKGFDQNEIEINQHDWEIIFNEVICFSDSYKYIIFKKAEKAKSIKTIYTLLEMKKDEFIKYIKDMSLCLKFCADDFYRPSNWGIVEGEAKIIDFGLTPSVYEKHYRRKY